MIKCIFVCSIKLSVNLSVTKILKMRDHIHSRTVGFINELFGSPISGTRVKAPHVKVLKKQQISDRGKFGG